MNKFLYSIFILVFIVIIFVIYNQTNSSKKPNRLTCQNVTNTYEEIYDKKTIAKAKELLSAGNYKLNISMNYAKKSDIKSYFSESDFKHILDSVLDNYEEEYEHNAIKYITINSSFREKDIDSNNGYISFDFIFDNQTIYKIKTEFKDSNIDELEDRVNCVIKSFVSIK
ncbi:hypothetical protein CPU12_01455 [Malaciobacter molluscorum LMG 25693]|uniref:Uncharacterized protein n=1 Tax=Malaciobacter molluscorum LMG 25693 TaxID=870501 RepID=A0A2G1DM73_9BACT|nr:hypothetical protein [Malaciobacter molluscorum]AXX92247.1 hypothetical protein AMOL_1266 [Malaciobacter molluscorum LMG 25693]PHO19474.1 hypothetical protein CPU12_01455 [Malaciobacter molluscorum LMG 25693]